MRVIGSGNNNRVDVLLIDQPPKITVRFRVRIFLRRCVQPLLVDVAQSDNVLGSTHGGKVLTPPRGNTDHADVLAGEQGRAGDLVAANRLIRQSAEQSGDVVIADMLEDLERVLMEIANAPANASSNDLTDLQSRITDEDLVFRLRVIAAEMRQRTLNDRATSDRVPAKKMPVS